MLKGEIIMAAGAVEANITTISARKGAHFDGTDDRILIGYQKDGF